MKTCLTSRLLLVLAIALTATTSFAQSPSGLPPAPRLPDTWSSRSIIPQSDAEYGSYVYSKLASEYPLDKQHVRYPDLLRVVKRLTTGLGSAIGTWHVHLFNDPGLRYAMASRGNRLFVWSGLLDAISNDEELAAILSHVIAHVIRGHTDSDPEIETEKMLLGISTNAANIALRRDTSSRILVNGVGNIGKAISRKKQRLKRGYYFDNSRETEADELSLRIMADAGYNPREVLFLWARARNDRDFEQSLQFFTIHPMSYERIQAIVKLLPEATERFERAVQGQGGDFGLSGAATATSQPALVEPLAQPAQPRSASSMSRWRVVNSIAVLFSAPDALSRPIGEFSKGARLQAVAEHGEWIQIETPDRGFLQKGALVEE